MGDNMKEDRVNIEKAMEFAARAEDAYRDHGIDFAGMRYAITDRYYGWALPEEVFLHERFREEFANDHKILHRTDGSAVEYGHKDFFDGPVTLITPYSGNYQYVSIHELAHQAFRRRFTLNHKPANGKVSLPVKVCVTLCEGIAEHTCFDELDGLMDERNSQIKDIRSKFYVKQLNKKNEFSETGFDSLDQPNEDFRHAVGYNFVLTTWEMGKKLSEYLDLIAEHPPNEEQILSPMKYCESLDSE